MNNLGQDSVSQQLANLQKESEILEQTVQLRNAEVQAAQSELSKLQDQIASKTSRLLKEQAETLEIERTALISAIESRKPELIKINKEITILETKKQRLESDVLSITTELKNTLEITKASITEHDILTNQIIVLEEIINGLKIDKNQLEMSLKESEESEIDIKSSILGAQNDLKIYEERLNTVKLEYSSKLSEKEEKLSLLDTKILMRANEIEQQHKNEEQTRNDLAIRQKSLDEWDKNLRIREEKVAMGEDKLIRHSNLLKL